MNLMNALDERRKTEGGKEIHVWIDFWGGEYLTLAIISGNFPPALSREEVEWLIKVLQKAVEE